MRKRIPKRIAKIRKKKLSKSPARPKITRSNIKRRLNFQKLKRQRIPRALTRPVTPDLVIPAKEPRFDKTDDRLPENYGQDTLVLMARDPWWLFTYWEVTNRRKDAVTDRVKQAGHQDWKTVLRVYDVTGNDAPPADYFFDIELNFFADNWYIDVGKPDREWMAELGFRTLSGEFFMLVTSNRIRTPAFGISEVVDEEWMMPENLYYQLIGLAGPGQQSGSIEVRRMLKKYLKRGLSSDRRAGFSSVLK